jgi:hypothetical protein
MKQKIQFTKEDLDDVADKLTKMLKSIPKKSYDYLSKKESLGILDKEKISIIKEQNLKKRALIEHRFISKIVLKLNGMISNHIKTVILWDVDGVLGYNNEAFGEQRFEIRPSIPLLFFRIKEAFPDVIFGIISNRGQSHLENAIFDKKTAANFASIGRYFDKNFIFSTRGFNKELNPRERFHSQCIFLKENMLYDRLPEVGTEGSLKKLRYFLDLELKNPEIRFIPIDDLAYAEYCGGISIIDPSETYTSMYKRYSKDIELLDFNF